MKPRSGGERFELRIEPGSEGVINLVAVAPTELHLSMDRSSIRHSGRSTFVTLRGTHKYLPTDTVCSVIVKTTSCGMPPRDYTILNVPMRINGESCSMEVEIDIFEASFFGKGTAELTAIPDFPFAQECKIEQLLEFDNPLGVLGLELEKAVLIGKQFQLRAEMSDRFKKLKATLRLSVFNSTETNKGEKPQMAPEVQRYATLEWAGDSLSKTKHWRVGCASSDDYLRLAYFESFKAVYAFDLRVEVLQELEGEEQAYLLWEKPQAFAYPRPKLAGFELKDKVVSVKVENLDADFKLPFELTLWQYEARVLGDAYTFAAMDPISKPVLVHANSPERFYRLHWQELWKEKEGPGRKVFALLRIPRSLTGTQEYVPIHAVMDYEDKKYLPFDDDELWLEPPKVKAQPKQKQQKTTKELATAIASQELPSRASRAPRFGEVWTGVRDNNLLVCIKLVGEISYWREAAPFFSLCDPSGETELMRLEAKPSRDNPRLYEALVPLEDTRILGKKVSIRGQVSRAGARLWEEVIADPPAFTLPYEGVPKLSDLDENIVKRTDDTSYLEVRCLAQHIPNGKDGSVIEFRLSEYFMDQPEPIFLAGLPFRYDLSKAKGGLCDSRGWVMARLQYDEVIKRIPYQGKFRLEARLLQNEKANRSIELPVIHKDIGTSPRRLEGTMVYGLHKNVSREFRQKVLAICSFLKMNPDHLMACMALETAGTFSPSIQNSGGSRAFGLIQFTAGPVKDIDPNLKLETLAAMTAVQQLDYVQAYFVPFVKKAPLTNIGDVYMAILCQRGVGQPPDYVCYKKGQDGYAGNASLDVGPNGKPKGYITKGDATARAERWLAEGQILRG